MTNPYDAPPLEPAPTSLSEVQSRHGRGGVESADFIRVGFMMQLIGGALLIIGVLLFFLDWRVGAVPALVGALIFIPGRGLAAYKPWAWYAAVLVALPLSVLPVLIALFLSFGGMLHWELLVLPLMLGFVDWVLLSNSGRDRYRVLCESASKRKSRSKQPKKYGEIDPELFASAPAVEAVESDNPFADRGGIDSEPAR